MSKYHGALEILARNARQAGIDLNTASEQMFRVSPDYLSESQRLELLTMLCRAAREVTARQHRHFCVECGESKSCDKKDCEHTETICYRCNEGGSERTERWLHNKAAVMHGEIKAPSIYCTFLSRINMRLTTLASLKTYQPASMPIRTALGARLMEVIKQAGISFQLARHGIQTWRA